MSDSALYKILENFNKVDTARDKLTPVTSSVNETQTKVQTMGNKVKVTKDGDTTEFDDAETAKDFMGDKEDNQFATEGLGDEFDELSMLDIDDDPMEIPDDDFGLDADTEFGTWDTDMDEAFEFPATDFKNDFGVDAEEDENGPEFDTFDSNNESHRKRLQRGTPVVLSKELFKDPDVNRRGVFVNRSPSGHYGTVIRDVDGKEVKVHLSDIVSADLVNNSVYEQYGIDFDKLLAEDITMTQTTNLENPENDTTTVTAVGNEAGEELAAMMANAGLKASNYGTMDTEVDIDDIDTGEAEPVPMEVPAQRGEMNMRDMLSRFSEPEVQESFDDDYDFGDFDGDTQMDLEPSDSDLDSIDSDPDWDLDFDDELTEDDIQYLSPEIAQAIIDGADIAELINDESVPQKDREALSRDLDELMLGGDNELTAYENLAGRIYDMYGGIDEERDIEYTNTPGERTAGVDMVTHGTSGGLNKPKRMYKPAAGGDNAMQRPMTEADLDEALSPEMQKRKERDQEKMRVDRDMSRSSKNSRLTGLGRGTAQHDKSVKFGFGEDITESKDATFDSFLNLYKAFSIRGEKK